MGVNIPGINIFSSIPPLVDPIFDTTGRVFFVGSTAVPGGVVGVDAAGAYGDSPQRPFATIDYAHNQCAANRGDLIIVLPGHAETTTAAITCDLAGVRIAGLGVGRNRPAITANFASAGDTLTITAASVWIKNLRFVASSAAQTSQINIGAADATIQDCVLEQGANNVVTGSVTGAITIASGAHRFKIKDCLFLGTANGPDYAIAMDIGVAQANIPDDWEVTGCTFNYVAGAGLDLAGIYFNNITEGYLVKDCIFMGMDATALDFNSIATAGVGGDGFAINCQVFPSTSLATIANLNDLGGTACVDMRVHNAQDDTNAARIPATTAS